MFLHCMCFYFFDEFVFIKFAPSNKTRFSSNVVAQAVEELDKILALNNLLITLKNHPDADRFSPGVGPLSVLGMDPNYILGQYGCFDMSKITTFYYFVSML